MVKGRGMVSYIGRLLFEFRSRKYRISFIAATRVSLGLSLKKNIGRSYHNGGSQIEIHGCLLFIHVILGSK